MSRFLQTLSSIFAGLPWTLVLTFAPLLLAFLPGLYFGWLRARGGRVAHALIGSYITLFRAIPLVLQMLFAYSWLPSLLARLALDHGWSVDIFAIPPVYYAILILTLNTIAVLSEVFRAAFAAVQTAEAEAALAAGFTKHTVFGRIWLPQALSFSLPNLASTTVNLVRQSALAYLMTVPEMTAQARTEAGINYDTIQTYAALLFAYVLLCFVIDAVYDALYAQRMKKVTRETV